jgi:hypothetical protein
MNFVSTLARGAELEAAARICVILARLPAGSRAEALAVAAKVLVEGRLDEVVPGHYRTFDLLMTLEPMVAASAEDLRAALANEKGER